jgi:formiminotetrahydrofolate cyclodeaminase
VSGVAVTAGVVAVGAGVVSAVVGVSFSVERYAEADPERESILGINEAA